MNETINKYKYWVLAVILVALFFIARSCENNKYNQQKGENKELAKQVKKAKDGLVISEEARRKQKDSISLENLKKETRIKELQDKLSKSENKVTTLEKSAEKTKERIKNMSYVKVADSLNTIYKTKNAVAEETGVSLKGDLPNQVLNSVVDANTYKYISVEKDNQLKAKDDILQIKDKQLKDKSLLLVSAEKNLNVSKELNGLQTIHITGLEKENRSLRNVNTLEKILIPVSAVLGYIIGNKVVK